MDLELRFARFEWLSERQPLLINAVLLRQNPNNVPEWLKRGELYAKRNDDAMVIKTYTEGLQAVDAVEAVGRVYRLWIAFAQVSCPWWVIADTVAFGVGCRRLGIPLRRDRLLRFLSLVVLFSRGQRLINRS